MTRLTCAIRVACAMLLSAVLTAGRPSAQEMEPRAYSPSPVGANFFVGAYSWSTGSVLTDPTVPIADVNADVQGLAIAFGHTFNLFGRLGMATAAIPYALADVTGKVFEEQTSVSRSGLADAQFRVAANLRGVPAMSPREFARSKPTTIIGTSLSIQAPAGQYYDTKLVNLGTNRWAFKPEIGVSLPLGRWDVDGYFGTWIYTSNSDYFPGGRRRSQDPVLAVQGHVSYTLRPRLWLAYDATWYHGGSAEVEDASPTQSMNNARMGVTLSLPVGNRYSAKVAYGNGIIARTGSNFSTIAVAWQVLWLSPRWSGK